MDPLSVLAMFLSSGANIYGSNEAANAQEEGARQQAAMAKWMYNQDTEKDNINSSYLNQFLPTLPSAQNYFGSDGINQQYDIARQNLNQTMGNAVTDASAQAGALGASRGFANNSGFVNNSANQVRQSFFPQFGALEQGRAGALQQGQKDLYGADTQRLLAEYMNRFNLVNQFGAPNQVGQQKKQGLSGGVMGGGVLGNNFLNLLK